MATGAAKGQPEECLAKGVDPVVDPVRLILLDVDRTMNLFTEQPEASAENRFIGPAG